MAYMTNLEFAELEFRRQKRNEYVSALIKEVRQLREENARLKAALEIVQRRERDARNELCQRCGRYHEAHKGACDGCKWRGPQEEEGGEK